MVLTRWGTSGFFLKKPAATFPLRKAYRMSLLSAWSISLDSTFKEVILILVLHCPNRSNSVQQELTVLASLACDFPEVSAYGLCYLFSVTRRKKRLRERGAERKLCGYVSWRRKKERSSWLFLVAKKALLSQDYRGSDHLIYSRILTLRCFL